MSDKPAPFVCPKCRDTENYFGVLRFPDQPLPTCPNHGDPAEGGEVVELVPVE